MVDWIALLGNFLLFSLVFGMSATVDMSSLRSQMTNGKAILTGIFCQFVVLPLLGFLVVYFILDVDHSQESAAVGLTLLVVTSSPGGSYSNWWCSLFNGDLALSVTMTAISTLLSVVMLPANLLLYTHFSYDADVVHNLDWTALIVALLIVISAIAIGLACSYKIGRLEYEKALATSAMGETPRPSHRARRLRTAANQLGNWSGLCLIVFSATMTNTGSDQDAKIWSRDWSFYVGVALPCLGGLILANIISTLLRLPPPERVTTAVECCYQNVGIATSLALTMFDGKDLNQAMGVPFFYGLVEALFVSLYCIGAWKAGWTKAPANAPIWTVITTSYEILESEEAQALNHQQHEVLPQHSPSSVNSGGSSSNNHMNDYIEQGQLEKQQQSKTRRASHATTTTTGGSTIDGIEIDISSSSSTDDNAKASSPFADKQEGNILTTFLNWDPRTMGGGGGGGVSSSSSSSSTSPTADGANQQAQDTLPSSPSKDVRKSKKSKRMFGRFV